METKMRSRDSVSWWGGPETGTKILLALSPRWRPLLLLLPFVAPKVLRFNSFLVLQSVEKGGGRERRSEPSLWRVDLIHTPSFSFSFFSFSFSFFARSKA